MFNKFLTLLSFNNQDNNGNDLYYIVYDREIYICQKLLILIKHYDKIKLSDDTEVEFNKVYLDGELYHHKIPLNEINSIVKNTNNSDETDDRLEFHIFDCFVPIAHYN